MKHGPADRHQQMIAKVCDPAADKNMTGIKEIHQACQYITDHLSTIANDIQGRLIALAARRVDIFRAEESPVGFPHLAQDGAAPVSSRLERFRGDRRSRCHGFKTSLISTRAQGTFLIHTDMPDIPCTAVTAAMELAVGNDASPDS